MAPSHTLLQSCAAMCARHPRRAAAALGVLLLGSGATAWAVANLLPAPELQPVRDITESVPSPILERKLRDGFARLPITLFRTDTTRSSDSAQGLLRRLGALDASAAAFIRSDEQARQALLGPPGRTVSAVLGADQTLNTLTARWVAEGGTHFQRLVMERPDGQWTSRLEQQALSVGIRMASGVIRSSLFAATDEAGVSDAIAVQLAEIFSGDIDFHRELRQGDRFSVIYEQLEGDGEPLRTGRVLSAEFVNNGRAYSAVWFHEPSAAQGAYFTLDGNSLRRAFLASPLEFSRVTSGFGGRIHPIAREFRMHRGVDYAAPTGTPIRTVGDGVVQFAGVQRGYGNVVEIAHRDNKSTLYAHLHQIRVKKGQRVAQGDHIGTVGSTGWSTGPHLHFEFRVGGVHHNPLTLAKQSESIPVSEAAREQFTAHAAAVRRDLAAAATLRVASAQ